MILTQAIIKRFNDFNQRVFHDVKVKDKPLQLNGSYTKSPWASDIDLYSKLTLTKSNTDRLQHILSGLIKSRSLIVYKITIGDYKYEGRGLSPDVLEDITVENIETADKKWVKVNMMCQIGFHFEEISVLYDFSSPMKALDVRKSITEDVKKYAEAKDYYKMIKREMLLLKPTSTKYKRFKALLQSPQNGQLYLAKMRAENIQTVIKYRLFSPDVIKMVMGNLRQLVKVNLGLPQLVVKNTNLQTLITQLAKILNKNLIS
jgi:hypothetical protein